MSVARFRVTQAVPMDDASKPQTATILIDRAAELITAAKRAIGDARRERQRAKARANRRRGK